MTDQDRLIAAADAFAKAWVEFVTALALASATAGPKPGVNCGLPSSPADTAHTPVGPTQAQTMPPPVPALSEEQRAWLAHLAGQKGVFSRYAGRLAAAQTQAEGLQIRDELKALPDATQAPLSTDNGKAVEKPAQLTGA